MNITPFAAARFRANGALATGRDDGTPDHCAFTQKTEMRGLRDVNNLSLGKRRHQIAGINRCWHIFSDPQIDQLHRDRDRRKAHVVIGL